MILKFGQVAITIEDSTLIQKVCEVKKFSFILEELSRRALAEARSKKDDEDDDCMLLGELSLQLQIMALEYKKKGQ